MFLLTFPLQVGWNSAKDYHTFVWVEPCLDVVGEAVTRQTFFKGEGELHVCVCNVHPEPVGCKQI